MLRVLHVSDNLKGTDYQLAFLFSYTCTEVGGALPKGYAIWKMTVSEKCCLGCHETVYKDGLEMEPVNLGGRCETIETSVCRYNPDTKKAQVDFHFHYSACCSDDTSSILNFKVRYWTS